MVMIDPLLQYYKSLLEDVSKEFEEATKRVPEIPCRIRCVECCKQIFPLSIIEAFYINEAVKSLPRETRKKLEAKAKKAQNKLNKLINAKDFELTNSTLEEVTDKRNEFASILHETKLDCPFLTEDKLCAVYKNRNHDCRIHGASYDESSGEIIGCFRHKKLFWNNESRQNFYEKTVKSNYRYREKNKLDAMLLTYLSKNPNLEDTIYITTPYIAILKDFRAFDWQKFFANRNHSLILDNVVS